MSATASRGGRSQGSENVRKQESVAVRAWFWVIGCGVAIGLGESIRGSWNDVLANAGLVALWILVTAAADLMPVTLWGTVSLSMSLPVTLAAGMVLPPSWAAGIAFLGALDVREFRGQISLARDLYNRSQVAVSVLLASVVFHRLGGDVREWPAVLGVAAISLLIDWATNSILVVVPVGMLSRLPLQDVIRHVYGDSPLEHAVGYVCLGLLAIFLAVVAVDVGPWGLGSFLVPLVLARQMFLRGRRLEEAARTIRNKNQLLAASTEQVVKERRDERMVVAGELHDEVLPPLFKVHLMGQVLRQDLNSGRLFDLDEDLPHLLSATEAAQSAIRELVSDLRRSPLGAGGLNSTIRLLAQQLETAGSPPIHLNLEEVHGSYVAQLLIYQVAREAMNNAARHSRASRIEVSIWKEDGLIRLRVADNGIGFDPRDVDQDAHFGLQLIFERIEAAAGRVVVDSMLGRGTIITATMAPEVS